MGVINIPSYQKILGRMIEKLLARTAVNDLNPGSVNLTMLEAAADTDFDQFTSLLMVLDSFSVDNLNGQELQKKAREFGVIPRGAVAASGYITVTDNSFEKIASEIYVGTPPPIVGDTLIRIADASEFPTSGSVYVGRGTENYEGPFPYGIGDLVQTGTYWTLTFSSGQLNRNHNTSESVVVAQGGNRTIGIGTTVVAERGLRGGTVNFSVQDTYTVPDGEDTLENVFVVASRSGSQGNIPASAIARFGSAPFAGAQATNPQPFSNGRNVESDDELKARIKDTVQALSRGTRQSILSSVIGVTSSEDAKTVASASLLEPTDPAELATLYIDDGLGFEPSAQGQGQESIYADAAGTEQYFQLGLFPLTKPEVECLLESPYDLSGGETLTIKVNGIEETITFDTADFLNAGHATAIEVAAAINAHATAVDARTSNNHMQVVVFPRSLNAERIEVTGGNANDILGFPTDETHLIRMYRNDEPLVKDGETAAIESAIFDDWDPISAPAYIGVKINNKPTQYVRLTNSDVRVSFDPSTLASYVNIADAVTFAGLGTGIANASLEDWVAVLDSVIVGATVSANANSIRIVSDLDDSEDSKVQIVELSALPVDPGAIDLIGRQGWPDKASVGRSSDFQLNRFNGQGRLADPLSEHDVLSAGTRYSRAFVASLDASASGTFQIGTVGGRKPFAWVVIDGDVVIRELEVVGSTTELDVTVVGDQVTYTEANALTPFDQVEAGDYIGFIYSDSAAGLSTPNTGLSLLDASAIGDTIAVTTPAAGQILFTISSNWANVPEPGDEVIAGNLFNVNNRGTFTIIEATSSTIKATKATANTVESPVIASVVDLQVNMPALFRVVSVGGGGNTVTVTNPNGYVESGRIVDADSDIAAFSSTVAPQLFEIKAATSTSFTPSEIADLFAAQVMGGDASVFRGTVVRPSTATYAPTGRICIPIQSGELASQLDFSADQKSSNPSHIAALESAGELGVPVFGADGSITSTDSVDPLTLLVDTGRTQYRQGHLTRPDQRVSWLDGVNDGISAIIDTVGSLTDLTLREAVRSDLAALTEQFNQKEPIGPLSEGVRYQQYWPFNFRDSDQISVIVDGDRLNRSYLIPMARNGTVDGSFVDANEFNGIDADSAALESFGYSVNSIWNNFDFADFKVMFRSRGIVNPGANVTLGQAGTNDGLVLRAVRYGESGDRVRFTLDYADGPNEDMAASYQPNGSYTDITVKMASDAERPILHNGATDFDITVPVAGQITYTWNGSGTNPQFAASGVAVGDVAVIDSPNFHQLNRGKFIIVAVGADNVAAAPGQNYITVLGTGTAEANLALGSADNLLVFEPRTADNTASNILAAINDTDGVNGILSATLLSGNDGTGVIKLATRDDATVTTTTNGYLVLKDGENWISVFRGTSDFVLKQNLDATLIVSPDFDDEPFKLIPVTAENLYQWFTRPAVTALTNSADVLRTDGGNRIQLASRTLGEDGRILVSGGFANQAEFAPLAGGVLDLFQRYTGFTPATTITVTDSPIDGFYRYGCGTAGSFAAAQIGDYLDTSDMTGVGLLNERNRGLFRIVNVGEADTVLTVTCVADVADSLDGTYFVLTDDHAGTSYYVWLDTPAGAGDPAPGGTGIQASIATNATASAVATAVAAAINGDPDASLVWKASASSSTVTISSLTGSTISSTGAGTSGFTLALNTDGSYVDVINRRGLTADSGSNGYRVRVIQRSIRLLMSKASSGGLQDGGRLLAVNATGARRQNGFESATTVEVDIPATGQARYLIGATVSSSNAITITHLTDHTYRFVCGGWSGAGLARLQPGDQLDTLACSGLAAGNQGQFVIVGVNTSAQAIDVINPNGSAEVVAVPAGDAAAYHDWRSRRVTAIDNTTRFTVERINADICRFRHTSGTAPDLVSCWVDPDDYLVVEGSTYSAANRGRFRIAHVEQDAVYVFNPDAVEETVTSDISADMLFWSVNSAFVDDTLKISDFGNPSWFHVNNRGNRTIVAAGYEDEGTTGGGRPYLTVSTTTVTAQSVVLGSNPQGLYVEEADTYQGYRTISHMELDPDAPDTYFVWIKNDLNYDRFGAQLTTLSAADKLNFSETEKVGLNAYRYWTGLLRDVHYTVDGLDSDPVNYPGIRAAGVQLEIRPPLIRRISLTLDVRTLDGTSIILVAPSVQSEVVSYLQSLPVGGDVILSEVISRAQRVPGVQSVRLIDPAPESNVVPERIVIRDNEKPIAFVEDIIIT